MKKQVGQYKIFALLLLLFGGIFSLVAGQYYYFDNSASSFQQGCTETVAIKINMEGQAARAGRFHLILNTGQFSYSMSNSANDLRTLLFQAGNVPFTDWSSSASPSWKSGSNHTILQIDRKNDLTNYGGNGATYGTFIGLLPLFNPIAYTGILAMEYFPGPATTETTLSALGGFEIINSAHQLLYVTGYFYVQQAPCIADSNPPIMNVSIPINGAIRQSHLSGISLTLTEPPGVTGPTNIPYVRTGGGVWTGNIRPSIDNQYGINFSTFTLLISGNSQQRYFTGGMFSPSGPLSFSANGTTWQFLDKNYTVHINDSELFNYGIEQPITISLQVSDRKGNPQAYAMSFNPSSRPKLIAGSDTPHVGDTWINVNQPIKLGIEDTWAGVNSGTIRITLSGVAGTNYGPYIFSGSDLNLSGVRGTADQPDQYITINNHPDFPYSGTIRVIVDAWDMVGNPDQISDYTFSTRPSCIDLGCCNMISIQTGISPPFIYLGSILNVSGGINPSFTRIGNTGTLDCGTENQGIHIYKGTEQESGSATHVNFFDLNKLILSGASNVKAILSGKTIYLQKIYVPPFTGGCVSNCGGGPSVIKDDCKLPSNLACATTEGIDNSASYYDATCCAPTTGHGSASCDTTDSPYDNELTEAYQWGYNLNITNKCPITTARLDDNIIRMEAAKMMTMFTIQIIGLYPDTHKAGCDTFTDTKDLSDEMKFFTKTACQLDLMGLNPDGKTPDTVFNPYDFVDRAQFGTILSRLIYGDVYNIYTGENYKRYEKHLKALHQDAIMKKIQDPFILEKRARILLMLKRTNDGNLVEKYRLVTQAHNGVVSLLENVR